MCLFALSALVNGCSKQSPNDSASSKYYLRFKIDGQSTVFTYSAGAGPSVQQATSGVYSFAIVAAKNANGVGDNMMNINLYSATPVNSTATFQDPLKVITGVPQIIILYIDEHSDAYTSLGLLTSVIGIPGSGLENVVADAKTTISEMTNNEVKGNFSASLYSVNNNYTKKYSITNGEFYLPKY
jgi:hypothetical protein